MLLTGALWAGLLLKGADGSLRYSLQRTSTELLFVPLPDGSRSSAKTAIDVVVQRSGQALASIAILTAVELGLGPRWLAGAILVLAVSWLGLSLRLRTHYLDLFRQTLQESAAQPRFRLPELDLSSLETVIATLNSQNDAEVRAALDFLEHEGKSRLIPALILYHPSEEVVLHALELFTRARRDDFVPIADRLLDHPVARIRAAALKARSVVAPDRELLERYAGSSCAALSATALVALIAHGFAEAEDVVGRLDAVLEQEDEDARVALAEAIGAARATAFETILMRLSDDSSEEVRRAALAAMARTPSARYLPCLTRMLEHRALRAEARRTLLALGEGALSFLSGALSDPERPVSLRRHLPRTLMLFDPRKASRVLLEQLVEEQDGVVRYKILRALGRLRQKDRKLPLDRAALDDLIERTVTRMYLLMSWRIALEQGRLDEPRRATPAQRLLTELLQDKEKNGIERLFRLLGLRYSDEDIATIYRGLSSRDATVVASSRELLESRLESPLKEAVLGLIDDASDSERLEQAGPFHDPEDLDYQAVLAELLSLSGESLRSLAVYHVAELGLTDLRPAVEAIEPSPDADFLSAITKRALESLTPAPEPAAAKA